MSRSSQDPWWRRAYFGWVKACFKFFTCPFFTVEVENRPDFRGMGPVVLAPNHVSYLDPPVLQWACDEHVTFLMTEAIYRIPLARFFFKAWGAIPVPEGRNAAQALKDGIRAIKSGRPVAIFPEGHISTDGNLKRGRGGVVTLIARGQVPVIPVAILGTFHVLPRHRKWPRHGHVVVRFGKPIPAPGKLSREQVPVFAEKIMDAIADLGAPQGRKPASSDATSAENHPAS